MNDRQRETWRRAEDHVWRAMYVVVINIAFFAVLAIFAVMAGQATARQLVVMAPVGLVYVLLAWGIWRRHSRVAATILLALSAVPFGARLYRHAWGSALISAVFVAVYAFGLYGTIILHQLQHRGDAGSAAGRATPPPGV